jgi:D-psicose/D-tagatose/L-ribulose 3-epimerase
MNNAIGVHASVWVGGWTPEDASHAIVSSRDAGYDYLELALLDPWSIDVPSTRALLAEHGLAVNGSLGLADRTDINSEDEATVAAGERLLRQAVDVIAGLDGDYLCGVIYSKMGRYLTGPTESARANAVAAIRRVADHAADSGVRLGLEVVNRYETNLLNTARQAVGFAAEVDRPNVFVHLDTYHMNIEEPDMTTPVLTCGDRLGYVHIGESHRGYLGSGSVDFGSFFRALASIDYAGPIAFESFSSAVVSANFATALCIWRNLWDDGADLAMHARAYIDGQIRAVESITQH